MAHDYAPRRKANEASKIRAEHDGEIWEAYEIELLEEGWSDDETTVPEIAELLGRTIEACRQKHYDLKRQREQRAREGRRKSANNGRWDRGWTSLEDMGF